jgi:hypothetical protein
MKVRTMKRFTCDARIHASVQLRKQKAAKAEIQTPTADEKPIDLNEIHRRFWARQAGTPKHGETNGG